MFTTFLPLHPFAHSPVSQFRNDTVHILGRDKLVVVFTVIAISAVCRETQTPTLFLAKQN